MEVELGQLPGRVDRLEGAVADDLDVGAQVLELDVLLGRDVQVDRPGRGDGAVGRGQEDG